MTEVFADTFYLVAVLSPQDDSHEQAMQFAQNDGRPIVTTAWVLTELADGLAQRADRTMFRDFLVDLESQPNITIVPAADELWRRGIELYASRPDKEWSLTDCISFIVMQDRQLTEALTGDHHFEQAGFRALLK